MCNVRNVLISDVHKYRTFPLVFGLMPTMWQKPFSGHYLLCGPFSQKLYNI